MISDIFKFGAGLPNFISGLVSSFVDALSAYLGGLLVQFVSRCRFAVIMETLHMTVLLSVFEAAVLMCNHG
ncbi:hypothetical protein CRES_1867 [Corynebacterium resistens DSM 45100]|uniref:Uncharacterized protein n=1 Tax=Corynebacterium resistens (strain DSM 45100 / JCM 12819 / GTC 2026 / SICGH 158) TaxID=662755 RepID=F8E2A2_CORRG|nr:hypothetical protein CRES_1867 [Corynebacterium resistens DSM 45100]